MGLLDRVRRVKAYHFESDILFIEFANEDDEGYFKKGGSLQHLELIAQDATGVRELRIRTKGSVYSGVLSFLGNYRTWACQIA
ncbi:MAG: hypothetical protein EBV54_04505 [Burkholderiaceae bacterium]|nr:hypothetical protein [Burkholderiaceae bacterium]